jgi:hypothetical protein
MPRVRLLEQAAREAVEAAAWYEQERAGLGQDFAAALEAILELIEEGVIPLAPLPGAAGASGARRIMLRRFPYDVIVHEALGETLIVAVAHQSRRPGYWVGRLG